MNSYQITLTCQDDIVLSQSAATTGGHRSLDYIPGATLLGASAANLYRDLGQTAFDVYHAGKVRFGNALPLTDNGQPTAPVPLAWHHAKGEPVYDKASGALLEAAIYNFSQAQHDFPADQQPKQMRQGFVTADGRLQTVNHNFRLKTAVDRNRGAAAESQLFGYESIRAGTRFTARVDFDDDIGEEIRNKVMASVTGELRIGRSRGAQYGRVLSEPCHQNTFFAEPGPIESRHLRLWLLSDLLALDDLGQPTLSPKPEWLGLPPGRLVTQQSFMQTRRYSPYHGVRRAYDIERQTIRQGSVLSFELSADPGQDAQAQILSLTRRGLGLHREHGLGQVWLNPPLLEGTHPVAGKSAAGAPAARATRGPAPTPFTRWLAGTNSDDNKNAALDWAQRCAAEALTLYRSSARFEGGTENDLLLAGPSLSQWGRLEQIAKDKGVDVEAIHDALFAGNSAVCKENDAQWKRIGSLGDQRVSFRHWLMSRLGKEQGRLAAGQLLATGRTVALLAETIRRELNSIERSQ